MDPGSEKSTEGARRRVVRATAFGNVVEWYDFGLYGAFANAIAASFFPGDAPARTLAVFAAFGVAFLFRPAGALLFGHLGDKYGRRNTLATTILVTSVSTGVVGLLPGYQAIGPAAPALLVLLRIVQGMAIGGAYGGATAFIVEHAPSDRRGAHGGVQWSTMALGLAMGAGTGALLTELLPGGAVEDWGWRVAFLAALPLGLVSLYIRLRTEETPKFRALRSAGAQSAWPVLETIRNAPRELLLGLGLVAALSSAVSFFFVFLPNQLARTGRTSASWALAACVAGLLMVAVVSPVAGSLSDRLGRRPVAVAGTGVLLVIIGPAFWMVDQRAVPWLLGAYLVVGLGLGLAVPSTLLSELFPTRLRYSGLSLTYGVGTALVGGSTPLLAAAVVESRGTLAPMAFGMVALFAGAVVCVALARETAPGAGSSSLGDDLRPGLTAGSPISSPRTPDPEDR